MEKSKHRQVWFAAVCFAMFAVTTYFLLDVMDVFSGEYDSEGLPVIVYYTIQTNVFAAVWFMYLALKSLTPKMRRLPSLLSMLVTLYVTITCVVYWLVLVPMLGFDAKLFSAGNIWMHAAVPVFAIALFFFVLRGSKIKVGQLGFVVIYPLAYLALAYVLRSTSGVSVYPFLDPKVMSGFGVALILVVIAVLFVGLGVLYRFAWNGRVEQMQRRVGNNAS